MCYILELIPTAYGRSDRQTDWQQSKLTKRQRNRKTDKNKNKITNQTQKKLTKIHKNWQKQENTG